MKNNAFTLVELLAVIAILAIIALIAVPIVINIINDSKEASAKDSINLYGRAIENAVADYFVKYPRKNEVTYEELEQEKMIEYKGNKVKCDFIHIADRKVYLSDCKVNDNEINYYYGPKEKNMLGERTNDDSNIFFINTGIKNSLISNFTIHTNGKTVPSGYKSKDCSLDQDRSVVCYWKEDPSNAGYYDMHIAADGEIYTPYNSASLFKDFGREKLTELNLTGLNTKYTIKMTGMFRNVGYEKMTTLNLGDKFDTSNVISMKGMFYGAASKNLQTINLGDKFDTSNVTDMGMMFSGMGQESVNMTELRLGDKFDTSNVTDMEFMFYGLGTASLNKLYLGKKFILPDDYSITPAIFGSCGIQNNTMRVYVASQTVKDNIKNLPTSGNDVPYLWQEDDNIIVVQQ